MTTAVVDQGNTRIKVALFTDDKLQTVLRFSCTETTSILALLTHSQPDAILYAASGDWNELLIDQLKKISKLYAFDEHLRLPFEVKYESRKTVGTDRLANVAMALTNVGKTPSLVVDMGTCITYDVLIDAQFVGGAISPGLMMRTKAMNAFTARLPEVQLNTLVDVLGTSTETSLQSGMYHGWLSESSEFTARYATKYTNLKVFYTGGDLCHFEAGLKSPIFADPYWTLKGFNQILLFNAQ